MSPIAIAATIAMLAGAVVFAPFVYYGHAKGYTGGLK